MAINRVSEGRQLNAVKCQAFKHQVIAVQNKSATHTFWIRLELNGGDNSGPRVVERRIQMDGFNQPVRRFIIDKTDNTGCIEAHGEAAFGNKMTR